MEFVKEIVKATDSINELLLYSKPKQGKTDLISRLPDIGIIDIEGGSDAITGYKYVVKDVDPIKTLENLSGCLNWIIKDKPHKFYAFDTLTYLEDCCEIEGTYNYMNSVQGKNFNIIDNDLISKYPELKDYKGKRLNHNSRYWQSVNSLAQGYGYQWSRLAFQKYFDKMKAIPGKKIFIAHIKDKLIESKSGDDVQGRDINLTGKLKSITTSYTDTIGYLFRGKDGNTYISFKAGESVAEGSRRSYLSGQEVLVGEWDKEKKDYSKVSWEKVFRDLT